MKKGILGGTFNPIHNTHLAIGIAAKEQFSLDEVIFMPSKQPAYKKDVKIAGETDRLNMTELAVRSIGGSKAGFFSSDFEYRREGNTYTWETLTLLHEAEPETEFFFIIGADSLMNFDKWVKPDVISGLSVLLVAPREGVSDEDIRSKIKALKERFNSDIREIDLKKDATSSSEIRNGSGDRDFPLCPASVSAYIREHGLYGTDSTTFTKEDIRDFFDKMQHTLSPDRFMHSVGVAYMSSCLAYSYGVPSDKALVAGLLHDCAKEIEKNEMERLCDENCVPLTDIERRIKALIHARYGAYLVKHLYGIEDTDIINAVDNHTVGRPGMSRLEQIVFCADFLEPDRKYHCEPSLDELRKLIFTDIDKTTVLILENQMDYFKEKPRDIDPRSMETLEYYRNVLRKRGATEGI